jgi:hypothetical protein
MADMQDDGATELAWDQRALDAALRCSDAAAKEHHASLSIATLMPSLHLNLGDDDFRIGVLRMSEHHLAEGRAAAANMPDSPYATIRGGLDCLAGRLSSLR